MQIGHGLHWGPGHGAQCTHQPPPTPWALCVPLPLPAGPTYQNPKRHDFQHTLEREEGGEDDVEHSKGVLVGYRGSIELDEEESREVSGCRFDLRAQRGQQLSKALSDETGSQPSTGWP